MSTASTDELKARLFKRQSPSDAWILASDGEGVVQASWKPRQRGSEFKDLWLRVGEHREILALDSDYQREDAEKSGTCRILWQNADNVDCAVLCADISDCDRVCRLILENMFPSEAGLRFWQSNFGPNFRVLWGSFWSAIAESVEACADMTAAEQHLQRLLVSADDGYVNVARFAGCLRWFNTFPKLLHCVTSAWMSAAISTPFFHGLISRATSEALCKRAGDGYLARCSTSKPEYLVTSWCQKNVCRHGLFGREKGVFKFSKDDYTQFANTLLEVATAMLPDGVRTPVLCKVTVKVSSAGAPREVTAADDFYAAFKMNRYKVFGTNDEYYAARPVAAAPLPSALPPASAAPFAAFSAVAGVVSMIAPPPPPYAAVDISALSQPPPPPPSLPAHLIKSATMQQPVVPLSAAAAQPIAQPVAPVPTTTKLEDYGKQVTDDEIETPGSVPPPPATPLSSQWISFPSAPQSKDAAEYHHPATVFAHAGALRRVTSDNDVVPPPPVSLHSSTAAAAVATVNPTSGPASIQRSAAAATTTATAQRSAFVAESKLQLTDDDYRSLRSDRRTSLGLSGSGRGAVQQTPAAMAGGGGGKSALVSAMAMASAASVDELPPPPSFYDDGDALP